MIAAERSRTGEGGSRGPSGRPEVGCAADRQVYVAVHDAVDATEHSC